MSIERDCQSKNQMSYHDIYNALWKAFTRSRVGADNIFTATPKELAETFPKEHVTKDR